MPFERAELIQLGAKAEKSANTPHLNPAWKRAYIQLAQACDYLDAMIARTIIQKAGENEGEVVKKDTSEEPTVESNSA